ncbi:GlxA family transcriptional regulator [Undibacterium sp. Ji83W]|uniref:GlxA family transcriptional regulator n=1 Tax=Undibacterium sp. Ji83W TaxID=3413043 RepID=UPI003BF315B5
MQTETTVADIRILLMPLPEFALLPFGGFLDKLRFTADEADYSRQRYCTWHVLGLDAGSIKSSSGIDIQVQITPAEINYADFDYLVAFGGRNAKATQALAPRYKNILRKAAGHGVKLVCIDNACFLLAACGLLSGRKVALHWRHEAEFRASFPRIEVVSDQMYCFDGDRISCAGGTAAIDLAVEILARVCGRTRALKGLADMLVDEARSSGHQLRSLDIEVTTGRHTGRAIALMRSLLSSSKTTDELASMVGISRRQLDRLFLASHGMTAKNYWNEVRLEHVKWRLLNSDHSLATIADEAGIADVSYLGKIFRKRFGETPAQFRKTLPSVLPTR